MRWLFFFSNCKEFREKRNKIYIANSFVNTFQVFVLFHSEHFFFTKRTFPILKSSPTSTLNTVYQMWPKHALRVPSLPFISWLHQNPLRSHCVQHSKWTNKLPKYGLRMQTNLNIHAQTKLCRSHYKKFDRKIGYEHPKLTKWWINPTGSTIKINTNINTM